MIGRLLAAAALLATIAATPTARSVFVSADPDAEVIDGQYWVFPTSDRTDRLYAWSSPDLAKWAKRGVLLKASDIGWLDADHAPQHFLWAPDMLHDGSRWLLYYSVGPQNPTPSRLGVAVCAAPQGPCTDSGKPLLIGGNGFEAIDPAVFVDPKSGIHYLYAGGSAGAKLRAFVLGPDGETIDHEVQIPQPENFTEGVFMHERNGVYYLSYSHGYWRGASYSVHYSTGPSPLGPWTYRGAILTSDARYKGPGHHSFVVDPATGNTLVFYHRWEGQAGDGPYDGQRRIAVAPVDYGPDGAILPIRMAAR